MELVVDSAGSRSEVFCAAGLSLVHEQSPRPFHVRRAQSVHDDSPAIIPGQLAGARSTLMARLERSLSPGRIPCCPQSRSRASCRCAAVVVEQTAQTGPAPDRAERRIVVVGRYLRSDEKNLGDIGERVFAAYRLR